LSTKKTSIWFIINPISGTRRKKKIPTLIRKYLNHDKFTYKLFYTQYKGHAGEITRDAVAKEIEIVCAVGGDGSAHEVGVNLIHTDSKLAIIPRGSGNGISNHMGIPNRTIRAIRCLNKCFSISVDTVAVNNSHFLGIGGYGIDAFIAKKFDRNKKRGLKTYIKHTVKEFYKFKPIQVEIEIEEKSKKVEAFLLSIANTSEFGNRFALSPKSSVQDGIIEMVIIKPFPKWASPFLVARFIGKKGDKSKFVETIKFKKASLKLNEDLAHYDGEHIKERKRIKIEVVPHSLNVIVNENKLATI
jgi:YegS/Rv2252/BmrU family lipid kinase